MLGNVHGTSTSIFLNSESDTPLPLASTMTGAFPVRTTVTKKAVLAEPLAGTFTRSRRNSSISGKSSITFNTFCWNTLFVSQNQKVHQDYKFRWNGRTGGSIGLFEINR